MCIRDRCYINLVDFDMIYGHRRDTLGSVSYTQLDVYKRQLWNYNRDRDEVSLVFSFADAENTDIRNMLMQHDIKILNVDEKGNTTFAVCGYMNRGSHEGETGSAVYYRSLIHIAG